MKVWTMISSSVMLLRYQLQVANSPKTQWRQGVNPPKPLYWSSWIVLLTDASGSRERERLFRSRKMEESSKFHLAHIRVMDMNCNNKYKASVRKNAQMRVAIGRKIASFLPLLLLQLLSMHPLTQPEWQSWHRVNAKLPPAAAGCILALFPTYHLASIL